jgi:hypothetical protein
LSFLETIMKKLLTLSVLALTLAACSTAPKPVPPQPVEIKIYMTATYKYEVLPLATVVSVRPGKVGTRFCYTDSKLAGTQICNNLVTGSRTVQSGYNQGVVFTEPDAPTPSPALAGR